MYIKEKLNFVNPDVLRQLWQRFVCGPNMGIYSMSEFDEVFEQETPLSLARILSKANDFHTDDDCFYVDGDGRPHSGTEEYLFEELYDEDTLADAIIPYEDDASAMSGIEWPSDEQLVKTKLIAFVYDCARAGWDMPLRVDDVISIFNAETHSAFYSTVDDIIDGLDEEYSNADFLAEDIRNA